MLLITNLIITIRLSSLPMQFEVARTSEQKQLGLMYRKHWNKLAGMIFIDKKAGRNAFWMKNTYLNMTLVYLDNDCNLIETYHPVPLSKKIIFSKSSHIRYAIEINPAYTNIIFKYYPKFKHNLKRKLLTLNGNK